MIDMVTGTIQTAAPLDREVQSSFSLDVMATDQAENPQDRLSTVTVVRSFSLALTGDGENDFLGR